MENRKRYEKCKAFTLVEILIVVIIIGILAGSERRVVSGNGGENGLLG